MEEIRGSEGLNTFKEERFHRDATPFSVIIMTLMVQFQQGKPWEVDYI
jgi:hypothetical protein